MRILYFSRAYTVHDQRFLNALAETEHQIYFLRLDGTDREYSSARKYSSAEYSRQENVQGVQEIAWPGERQGTGGLPAGVKLNPAGDFDSPHLLAGLQRVIQGLQPDLILAGPLHMAAYLVARSGFEPLVSMSWGYDLLYDAPRDAGVKAAIAYTLAHSGAMVGDCATIRQLAIEYGMPDERIVTFPWGIDLEHFSPRSQPEPPDKTFTLLSTRGWEPIYGTEIIARAFVLAANQSAGTLRLRPDVLIRLIMLGNGSQAGLLRDIFQDGGVLDQVSFPGQIDQADLPGYYRAADLYVSASHSDGTSISLLEALACGRPVLASDIPGNREWIQPGVQGWTFPDGDAVGLAAAILHAVNHRPQLPALGMAARRLAEQRADWKCNFPKLFEAFEIALRANRTVA